VELSAQTDRCVGKTGIHGWCVPGCFRSFPSFLGSMKLRFGLKPPGSRLNVSWSWPNSEGSPNPISACQERRDVQSGNFDVRLPKDFESGKSSWSLSFESENLMAERFDNTLDNDQILSMYTRRHKMLFTYKNICGLKSLPDIGCGFRLVGSPAGVQRQIWRDFSHQASEFWAERLRNWWSDFGISLRMG